MRPASAAGGKPRQTQSQAQYKQNHQAKEANDDDGNRAQAAQGGV
jgi:hypothetical protein